MGEWNHHVDEAENRLYIELSGEFTAEESKESGDEVVELAEQMDPGFEVITVMEGLVPADEEAVKHIERGKRAVRENGAAAAVRVLPESATSQVQFENTGEGEEEYAVAHAESVEQAEALLDKRRQQA
ncbi:MAG: hypothetical protein ABEJ31_02910 [Haloarculaceae archaeon]